MREIAWYLPALAAAVVVPRLQHIMPPRRHAGPRMNDGDDDDKLPLEEEEPLRRRPPGLRDNFSTRDFKRPRPYGMNDRLAPPYGRRSGTNDRLAPPGDQRRGEPRIPGVRGGDERRRPDGSRGDHDKTSANDLYGKPFRRPVGTAEQRQGETWARQQQQPSGWQRSLFAVLIIAFSIGQLVHYGPITRPFAQSFLTVTTGAVERASAVEREAAAVAKAAGDKAGSAGKAATAARQAQKEAEAAAVAKMKAAEDAERAAAAAGRIAAEKAEKAAALRRTALETEKAVAAVPSEAEAAAALRREKAAALDAEKEAEAAAAAAAEKEAAALQTRKAAMVESGKSAAALASETKTVKAAERAAVEAEAAAAAATSSSAEKVRTYHNPPPPVPCNKLLALNSTLPEGFHAYNETNHNYFELNMTEPEARAAGHTIPVATVYHHLLTGQSSLFPPTAIDGALRGYVPIPYFSEIRGSNRYMECGDPQCAVCPFKV